MAPEKCVMERLAFIKYLYNCAVGQSGKPEPLCAASILTFHDAVELFLQLAAEYTNAATKNDTKFMDYWGKISDKLPEGQELTQKESMRRLNQSRVGLKHYGTRPIKLDIEGFRASTTNFFVENTLAIFGIEFADISLIELIQYENVKEDLIETEKALKDGKMEDALSKVGLAFAKLIDDYETRKEELFGVSPFFFEAPMKTLEGFGGDFDIQLVIEEVVSEPIKAIQDAMKIICLGIDYRRYAKFRLITPEILRMYDKSYRVGRLKHGFKYTPTFDDVQLCIDFVIESAIILQELDVEIRHH